MTNELMNTGGIFEVGGASEFYKQNFNISLTYTYIDIKKAPSYTSLESRERFDYRFKFEAIITYISGFHLSRLIESI